MPSRTLGAFLAVVMSFGSLTGCGKSAPPPPVDDSRPAQGQNNNNAPMGPNGADPHASKPGMSNTQKVVLLAGAAALYYMYKHHQSTAAAAQAGPDGQYYLSKNGRVYYRDAEHRAHWVTPPTEGVKVPESEAHEYKQFQGYNGSTEGRDLAGLGSDE